MAVVNDDAVTAAALTATWRGDPSDSENISNGASEIRSTRANLTGVVSQEHYVEVSGTSNSTGLGHHVEGSARVYVKRDDGDFGGGTVTVDESVGRTRYTPLSRKLEISTPDGWSAVGGVYPGLISASAVVPVPATDGWRLCNGDLLDTVEEDGIYTNLVERLNPGGTNARVPDLRGQFVRGVSGTRDTTFGNDQTELETYSHQDHAVVEHRHDVDHNHAEFTSADSDYTANGQLNSDGNISGRNVNDTKQSSSFGNRDAASNTNVWTDLTHTHKVNVPALGESFSKGVVGPDAVDLVDHVADETRPDNVALYYVIKL